MDDQSDDEPIPDTDENHNERDPLARDFDRTVRRIQRRFDQNVDRIVRRIQGRMDEIQRISKILNLVFFILGLLVAYGSLLFYVCYFNQ